MLRRDAVIRFDESAQPTTVAMTGRLDQLEVVLAFCILQPPGLSLDFERKAPFFPLAMPQTERLDACRTFVRAVRKLTAKPVIARVCHDAEKGLPQGQDPEGWLREGLLDAIVPATHYHEPDLLDWGFERFLQAARKSPRPCAVWPQIWPTPLQWTDHLTVRNEPERVVGRARQLLAAGADGVYYFNFYCYWPRLGRPSEFKAGRPGEYDEMFRSTARLARGVGKSKPGLPE